MNHIPSDNPIRVQVLCAFKRRAKDQGLIHQAGMVGQSESHFPCKAAYAVAVFDHNIERFTGHIRGSKMVTTKLCGHKKGQPLIATLREAYSMRSSHQIG